MNLKNNFLIVFVVFVLSTTLNHSSFAQTEQETLAQSAGEKEANQVVLSMKMDTKKHVFIKKSLDHIFKLVVYRLNQRGLTKEALQIQNEWNQVKSFYFQAGFDSFQLGDHPPLSHWLTETYNYIESLIGNRLCVMYHINDIKLINYGIPVSLSPEINTTTQTPWGQEEYLAHFVPMAGAVSYWSGVMVCEAALQSVASMFCSASLEISRYGIEEFLAPWVGEQIYEHYNPKPTNPTRP